TEGLDEAVKHRVWPVRTALEFWVVLAGQKERMIDAFDHFHQIVFRINTTSTDAPFFILIAVVVVALAAVAVALDHLGGAVGLGGQAALFESAVVVAEAHGTAGHMFADLVGHSND